MANVIITVPAGYAYFVTLVPAQYVPEVVEAIARHKGVETPTDPEQMRALAADVSEEHLHRIWTDFRAQKAAEQSRATTPAWRGAAGG